MPRKKRGRLKHSPARTRLGLRNDPEREPERYAARMSAAPLVSLVRKEVEKFRLAANLRTLQRPMFQVKRPAERRMSRRLEKSEALERASNLQIL